MKKEFINEKPSTSRTEAGVCSCLVTTDVMMDGTVSAAARTYSWRFCTLASEH